MGWFRGVDKLELLTTLARLTCWDTWVCAKTLNIDRVSVWGPLQSERERNGGLFENLPLVSVVQV